jgi:hypothetical protein
LPLERRGLIANPVGTGRLADLERLFDAIRSAPLDRVEDIIHNIRVGSNYLGRQSTLLPPGFEQQDNDSYNDYDGNAAVLHNLPFLLIVRISFVFSFPNPKGSTQVDR